MPVSPWARVSWISPARRWRSSTMPASRAWISNWACRSAFSAIDASSRRFASASSLIISSALLVLLQRPVGDAGGREHEREHDRGDQHVDEALPGRPPERVTARQRRRHDQSGGGEPGLAPARPERIGEEEARVGEDAEPQADPDQRRRQSRVHGERHQPPGTRRVRSQAGA